MNAIALYPDESKRRRILLVLCLGVVLIQVDTSLVNLAAPLIGRHLHVPLSVLQWTVDGYNLAYAALLMTGGTLADLFGRRRIFLSGIGLFIAGSVACALARGPVALIAGRLAGGTGAAMLVPASLALLRMVWDEPRERAHAIGIFAGMNGLAFALGPPLGGLLAWLAGWRSIFWLAVPTGLVVLWLGARWMPESRDTGVRGLDVPGQMLMALALAALVVAVIERGNMMAVCACVGIPALAAFLWREKRAGNAAMVPLALFGNRHLVTALCVAGAMTFGMYGVIFLVPMAWIGSGAVNVLQAGLLLLPMALSFAMVSRWSGALTRRFGARAMMTAGMAMIGLGLAVLAASGAAQPLWLAETGLLATGLGMALNTGPLLNVAVSAVEPSRAGTASALVNSGRMVGATLGVAVLGSIYAVHGFAGAMGAGSLVVWLGALLAFTLVRPGPCRRCVHPR